MAASAPSPAYTFEEFYKGLGFDEYPFSAFTSEHERDHRERLFVDISMYGPVTEGFRSGRTTILSGDRGTGKTAIIFDFLRQSDPKAIFIVNVHDFGEISENFSSADLYKYIIQRISNEFFENLGLMDRKLWKLGKEDRQKLSFYYQFLTRSGTKVALERRVRELQSGFLYRMLHPLYKFFRIPLNAGANAFVNIATDIVSSSTGAVQSAERWREFFQKLLVNLVVLILATRTRISAC